MADEEARVGNASAGPKGEVTVVALTRIQRMVAGRVAEAKATVPDFQVQVDADVGAAVEMRSEMKARGDEIVPSLNDFAVKACALALREHPKANGSYRDGTFELHSRVNIGIAVAAADALVVPTIMDVDLRALRSVAAEARRLAQLVRTARIKPSELAGATFTVSNLGMYGIASMTPVINPPQAAILGVGGVREVPAREAGDWIVRSVVSLTLSCDHRILYGADAAQFLSTVRGYLEEPAGWTSASRT